MFKWAVTKPSSCAALIQMSSQKWHEPQGSWTSVGKLCFYYFVPFALVFDLLDSMQYFQIPYLVFLFILGIYSSWCRIIFLVITYLLHFEDFVPCSFQWWCFVSQMWYRHCWSCATSQGCILQVNILKNRNFVDNFLSESLDSGNLSYYLLCIYLSINLYI